jgi:tetratricopeptide (TPR) repeat protein
MSAPEPEQPARGRRVLFTTVTLLVPLLALGTAELGLRLAGAGRLQPLFISHPSHPEWSLANPRVVERFFARADHAPRLSIETGFFKTRKNEGALRLVVQGGSSAAGFPYGYGASLAGMLEQRLRREFPEREIEVVTTAMSAVNSWTLLEFVPEILAIEPDAVLIYAGHNEFLGILGVGSAYSAGSAPLTRLATKLRHLRTYRVLEGLLARPHGGATSQRAGEEGAMMARVAAERRIPLGSDMYNAGVAQFERNMRAIMERYRSAGVPVLVATLASNERDHPPFLSEDPPEVRSTFDEVVAALRAGRPDRALASAEALRAQQPGSALAWFRIAEALAANGRADEATRAWQRARDLDLLRFRAPSEFNTLLVELARRTHARLVDVEALFRARSRFGAIGKELMLEHVHPNVDGYFLLAQAFHEAILDAGLLGPASRAVPEAVARREVPLSRADVRFGEYKLLRLMNHWPFADPPRETVLPPAAGLEDELAQALYRREIDWARMQDRLKHHYRARGDRAEHLRLALILADAFPFVAEAQREAGEGLMDAGRTLQAVRYLHRAMNYAPSDVRAIRAFAEAARKVGLTAEADGALERLRRLEAQTRP